MKVDDVVQQVLLKGRGSMLAKIDIKSAFRNVPVHPADRHLLGMMWKGQLFIDTVLPFGLRSAPKIFNCIADALQWIAKSQGVTYLEHFLDDYITVGAPGSMECDSNLATLISLCTILNLPLAAEKKEGPTTCLAFLGIEVDTERLELRLPAEKLKRLQALLQKWITYKCCKKRDLESLVGYLHNASTIVQPGRTFTRRLIDLLKTARHRAAGSFTRLNTEARSDILWWHSFIAEWNGLSMMHQLHKKNPEIILTSDASGSWGCGAFWNTEWFQYQWSAYTADLQITTKELMPIVISAAIWGPQWSGKSVQCRCDNEAVVSILNSGTSKDPTVMGLMRCLHFFAAKFSLIVSAVHLPGVDNSLADALSRNNLPSFLSHCLQACPTPTFSPGSGGSLQTGLDIPDLEQNVQFYLQSALAGSTMRAYASSNRRYTKFCSTHRLQPYPASEDILCKFVAYLGRQHLKHQTIKCYLSGIRFFHIHQAHPNPFLKDMPRLHYVLRGVKSEEAKNNRPSQQRLPVTPQILMQIQQILSHRDSFDHIMLWAAFLVCFFGFLRSGEITIPDSSAYDPSVHLSFSDISIDNIAEPNIIRIRLKTSKTDPFRQGVDIHIGKTNQTLCPVTALLNYMVTRGNSPGLLFHFEDNAPLTKSKFTARFRQLLDQAGVVSTPYAGHSFRIGAATTAAAKGVEDSLIQTLGRWKSSAYLTYVRLPPENLAAVSHILAHL